MKLDYQNWSKRIFERFYESNLFNSDTEYHTKLYKCANEAQYNYTVQVA